MSKSRTIGWVLLIAAVGAAGYLGWQRLYGEDRTAQADAQKRGPARPAVQVKIAPVDKADFPVYLTGLGTVQGFNTVLVRSRVDGQINRIAFQEGQFATRQQTDTQRSTVAQLTAQIAADTAAIENAQTQVDYATVKAPISGVAGLRQVDVGNIVNASTQTGIVTIAQIEPIAVVFTAPEDQLPYIKAALAVAPPKTIALSTDGKRVLSTGTLALINNQVDTSSGTIRLKAVFDNKDHALWPGQSVSTRLLVRTLKD